MLRVPFSLFPGTYCCTPVKDDNRVRTLDRAFLCICFFCIPREHEVCRAQSGSTLLNTYVRRVPAAVITEVYNSKQKLLRLARRTSYCVPTCTKNRTRKLSTPPSPFGSVVCRVFPLFLVFRPSQVVTIPGAGFGPGGEGFLRLSAFAPRESCVEAVERLRAVLA